MDRPQVAWAVVVVASVLANSCGAISNVYRDEHYDFEITEGVPYATTLVNCTDQTDASSCQQANVTLDIYQPLNATDVYGDMPVIFNVHGGGYTGGDSGSDPPCDYWPMRGFVCFSINYRSICRVSVLDC